MRDAAAAASSLVLLCALGAAASDPAPAAATAPAAVSVGARVVEAYTRYERLAPGSGAFRILCDVAEAPALRGRKGLAARG